MTYTPEQLKQKTDDEINEIAAVVCMGWTHIDESPLQNFYQFVGPSKTLDPEFFNDFFRVPYASWQPCSPTEAGKAQAMDLAEKYELVIYPASPAVFIPGNPEVILGNTWLRAVCEAAILSAQGEMK